MGIEILFSLLAASLSMVAGGVASSKEIQKFVRKILRLPEEEKVSYSERLSELTKKLEESSREVDEVLREIGEVTEKRQSAVEALEHDLTDLEAKEADLKEKISALENTPVEAAKHFADLVSDGEKRGAKRDYLLFGAGVMVSTVVAIAIQLFVGDGALEFLSK